MSSPVYFFSYVLCILPLIAFLIGKRAVGLEVLKILEDEHLQENAATVGSR